MCSHSESHLRLSIAMGHTHSLFPDLCWSPAGLKCSVGLGVKLRGLYSGSTPLAPQTTAHDQPSPFPRAGSPDRQLGPYVQKGLVPS